MIIAPGSTEVTTYFKLVDPTTGVPETGLVIANLDATYVRDRAAAVKADLTALAAVDSAHGDNKAIEVDAVNAPGLYRVDWPDTAFLAGIGRVQLVVNGAAIDPAVMEVELLAIQTLGSGAIEWTYTLKNANSPFQAIADADVWVTTDIGGDDVIASGKTNASGVVTFYLDAGTTVYVWRQKSGWNFDNPDTEEVS